MGLVLPSGNERCVLSCSPKLISLQGRNANNSSTGASLEEMDRVFKSRVGAEDAEMLAQAQRDVGLTQALEDTAVAAARGKDSVEHISTSAEKV